MQSSLAFVRPFFGFSFQGLLALVLLPSKLGKWRTNRRPLLAGAAGGLELALPCEEVPVDRTGECAAVEKEEDDREPCTAFGDQELYFLRLSTPVTVNGRTKVHSVLVSYSLRVTLSYS